MNVQTTTRKLPPCFTPVSAKDRERPLYVYVAGPYSAGDQLANVRTALDAANALWEAGIVPFVPHLTAFWHFYTKKAYADWLGFDMAWLRRCDALVRLPGISPGSDAEVECAKHFGLPVFTSVASLLAARLHER